MLYEYRFVQILNETISHTNDVFKSYTYNSW